MSTLTKSASAPASRASLQHLVSGLLGLLVGSLAVNGLPHLTQGLAGNVFQTPFGAQSSPAVNLVWGAVNLVIALGIGFLARHRIRSAGFVVGAGAGVLGTAASLLVLFS